VKARLWIGGLLLVAGLLLGLLLLWAHYGREAAARVHRAESHLHAERFQEALSLAEAALKREPSSARPLRIRVDALAGLESPAELGAAEELWQIAPSGDALVRLVQAAIRWDAPDVARHALESDQTAELMAPVDRFALEATVAARWRDYSTAVAAFDRAMALGYPVNDQSRLTLGILRVQEGDIAEGITQLEMVSEGSPYFSEAVRSLMTVYREADRQADVEKNAPFFFRSASISMAEKLATLDYLRTGGPSNVFRSALDWTWRSARTGAAVADLLIWCYRDEQTVQWADARLASLPDAAFEVLPLRLVAVARERQLRHAVTSGNPYETQAISGSSLLLQSDLSAFTSESAYAALVQWALLEDGDAAGSIVRRQVLMQELHAGLVDEPNKVEGVDLFARTFGLMPVWERALLRLIKEEGPVADTATSALYRIYSERKDARSLFLVMERAVERNPDNLIALNNYVHLGLLLGEDRSRFHRLAEQLHPYRLRDVRVASTCAFSQLLLGKPQMARDILEEHAPDTLQQPSVVVYYAATLVATGGLDRAQVLIASVDPVSLFPEEVELLETLEPAGND